MGLALDHFDDLYDLDARLGAVIDSVAPDGTHRKETEQQRDFLLRQGITLAQGFLFSTAVLPVDFAEYAQGYIPRS